MPYTHPLSKREQEVVDLLLQGKSNKQIALALGISDHTVEFHLKNVYAKLQVSSRAEAILKLGKSAGLATGADLGKSAVDEGVEGDHNQSELVSGSSGTTRTQIMDSRGMGKLIEMNKTTLLIGMLLLVILALVLSRPVLWERAEETQVVQEPIIVTAEVTRLVQEPIIVIPEVTRLVQEPIIVTADVTRLVQVPVVVATEAPPIMQEMVIATPAPPPGLTVSVTQGVRLTVPRTWHTATRLDDDRILLVGGSDGGDNQYALVEIYDPQSGLITQVSALNAPRHEHSATLLFDHRVLVVGGYSSRQGWVGEAEVYDPAADNWTVLPPIYSHGVQHTATRLADGRVLVIGGCSWGGFCTDRTEIFDPQSNTWTEAAPLESDRASQAAVLLDSGLVLVAGGAGPQGAGSAVLYDPLANAWIPTGPMVTPRVQASAIKLWDGRVLLVGGLNTAENPSVLASTEIYDPATNRWTAAAPLSQPRYAFTLEMLPDGQVITLGGARQYDNPWNEASFVREIESYDPLADRWYIAGELPQPVTYAAAAFLPDGRLWLSGGGAGHAIAPAWADTWLITPAMTQP